MVLTLDVLLEAVITVNEEITTYIRSLQVPEVSLLRIGNTFGENLAGIFPVPCR